MSVHQLRPRTPAETALIERAEGDGRLPGARARAIDALRRDGLPSRRVEAWHYTDLRALMGRLPEAVGASANDGAILSPLITGKPCRRNFCTRDLSRDGRRQCPDGG